MAYAGIDIGGTAIKSGIVETDGTIHEFKEELTESNYHAVIAYIKSLTKELSPKVKSIGIGFPSVVNPKDGCVYYPPNMPGWTIVPLAQIIQQEINIPVAVENDANTAALAESIFGAGKGISDFLYVTLGTGVGGGVIINGRIYTGQKGGAGEIGHIIVDINEDPTEEMIANGRAYRAGTLEERAGRAGIIAAAKRLARNNNSRLNKYGDYLDVEHISEEAYNGDDVAIDCLRQTGKILGLGLASALAILDMSLIVVGGGISQAHPILLESVHQTLQQRALPTIAAEIKVKQAHFTKYAGVIGAAMVGKMALERQDAK